MSEKLDPEKLCRLGQGPATCRYLGVGGSGWQCLRGTAIAEQIDARVARGDFNAQGTPETCCESPGLAAAEKVEPC